MMTHTTVTLVLSLFALAIWTMPLTHHDYAPFGMLAMAKTHVVWLVTIKRPDFYHTTSGGVWPRATNATRLIGEKLPPLLQSDECKLLTSGVDKRRIILEIYCPNPMTPNEERLQATLHYLTEQFGASQLRIESERPWRTPKPASIQVTGAPTARPGMNANVFTMEYILSGRQRPSSSSSKGAGPALSRTKAVRASDTTQTSVTWGLNRIVQPTGTLNGHYVYENTAESIDVYIVDTGIQVSHREFQGRALFYYNSVDEIDTDCLGHGTHVAGIVGALTYGVAKNVTLIGIKVLDCSGIGSTFTIIAGLSAVMSRIETSGRKSVINLSLGGDKSAALDDAILEIAQMNNTMLVVAAGNDGADACNYSPSDLGLSNSVLVVSATSEADACPDWANRGACVDISAPGVLILSTWIGSSNTSTAVLSGTSMATPFVTGAVALLLDQQSSLSVAELYALITTEAAMNVITGTTVQGGGKNLLQSLIHLDSLTTGGPTPAPTGAPVQPSRFPPPDRTESGAQGQYIASLLTLLITMCISTFV